MIEKYRKKVPAYRQIKDWGDLGLELTRQQITNWHIRACDYGLGNLYELMHQTLLKQTVVHADETSYLVLESEKVNTYFWVFASGRAEDEQIILYEHADSRATEVPKNFLNGYTHYLQTDGYQVYDKLDQVTRVACLSHIRRKFFEAMGKQGLSLIHISEPTRLGMISYAVFCLQKKKSYTHLRAQETRHDRVCRLLLEKKKRLVIEYTLFQAITKL